MREANYSPGVCHLCLLLGMMLTLSGCQKDEKFSTPVGLWERYPGPEGEVWRSESGIWRAEVEPSRGRLVYLGELSGPNLLNRPPGPPDNTQFGGHRIWLGPQTEWKVIWPPPLAWEMSPSAKVEVLKRGILQLTTIDSGDGTAVLTRSYRWIGEGRLECQVTWKAPHPQGYQSIQIVQLAGEPVVEARPLPRPDAPRGFVRLPLTSRPKMEKNFVVPSHIRPRNGQVEMHRTGEEEKLGFPGQVLTAKWKNHELRLHPGSFEGRESGDPDEGFRSQIYLGPEAWPVLEMEQLSPRLQPINRGSSVSHKVMIELLKRE
jgi:hypothetical protein